MDGVDQGQGVSGFAALPDSTFDPVKDGYPTSNPTTGFQAQDEWFAGTIIGTATSGASLRLYCIDLHTETTNGYGYNLGDWSDANVPNIGYVARILNENYPTNPDQPSTQPGPPQRAAAVQAAIWFFTDRYVLNISDPLHDTVAALVTKAIADGPLTEPPPPSLTISPPATTTGPVGQTIGPFTVNSSVDAVVSATGATMWSDATATHQINDGDTVTPGTRIWLKSTPVGTATLQATAKATVPSGNVYLYSGNIPGVTEAQKLILAQTADLTTTVSAQADFEATGSLEVDKTIGGPAAGERGPITISVSCDKDTPPLPDFTIPVGSTILSKTYPGITAGAVCTVTETDNGQTDTSLATVDISPGSVTIPANDTAPVKVTNTYNFPPPGSLTVQKTIAGPAAGQQGAVRIRVICDEMPDTLPVFVIDEGETGMTSYTYDGIAAGANCTVTEFVDGSTKTVQVKVDGSGQTVTVPAGSTATADLTDTYTSVPGSLTVQKQIGGLAAGRQGEVRIAVDCGKGAPALEDFVIPAGTKAGTVSKTYGGIPAGSVCTVTEIEDGHTDTVVAVVTGGTETATIPAADTATVDLSDLYTDVPGELVVTKTIGGPAAGRQGDVTIVPTCDGTKLPVFTIPAGTAAGSVSHTYPAIAAGASCTVTETVDGHTSTVAVAVSGSGQEVTIPANGSATATITDSYTDVPGTLIVNKTITGNAAGTQGPVTIGVSCGGSALHDFMIPAGTAAGTVSMTYTGIAAGSSCTVTESVDGHTTTVSVVQTGSGQQVTVPAAGAATADLADSYTEVPGALVVRKTITGPAAGRQGQVVIVPTCDGVQLAPFVIPAGAAAGDLTNTYRGVRAGATCSVTETIDGHTDAVEVQTVGSGTSVEIPANDNATVNLVDTYSDVAGSLVVQKTITGAAAGSQGAITIHVQCDDGAPALPDFVIPAGAAAGTVSQTYSELPAGASCVADETADGGTATVVAVLTANPSQATVPAGDTAVSRLADAYSFTPPDLTVDNTVPAETPSGSELPIKLTVANVGKVVAKAVTVCLRLHHALAFAGTAGGHLVGNGACWRVVQIVVKTRHTVRPIARSFVRHTLIRACSGVTVEARGVDLRKTKVCTYVLAAKKKPGGGVTG